MDNQNAATENENMNDESTIDSELEALLGDATSAEASESGDDASIDLDEIEVKAQARAAKKNAYANQAGEPEAPAVAANDDPADPAIAATPRQRSSRKRLPAGAKPSDQIRAGIPAEELLKVAMLTDGMTPTEANVDALCESVDKMAKKVGEKAVNVLRNKGNLAKLQGYTRAALELLKKQGGKLTSGELTKHFLEKYKEGTARSQSAQIMQLLPGLGICHRNKAELELRGDSELAKSFGLVPA